MTLFDLPPPQERMKAISVQRGRTRRQKAYLRSGIHPATKVLLAGNGETCGSCDHLVRVQHGNRGYYKCGLVEITRGPGSDIRLKWPACVAWEERV